MTISKASADGNQDIKKKGRDGAREQSEIYFDLQNNSVADNTHSMLFFLGNILNPLLV